VLVNSFCSHRLPRIENMSEEKMNVSSLLFTILFAFIPPVMADQSADKDLAKLQGTWDTVDFKADGDLAPDDLKKKVKLVFKDNKLAVSGLTKDTREYGIKLDTAKNPKIIYITPLNGIFKDQTVPGIYEVNEDSLKFVMPNRVIDTAPAAFESPKGSQLALFISKRSK
jgi:uncharacterized protein (TIGR03067 family)